MDKKTVFTVGVLLGLALGPRAAARAQAQEGTLTEAQRRGLARISDRLTYLDFKRSAVPSWMLGDLGQISGDPGTAALGVVRSVADIYRITGADAFTVRKTETDDIGQVHTRLQQRYRGLPVVGGELIVHMERDRAIGVNGHFVPDVALATEPRLSAAAALARAEGELASGDVTPLSEPELVVFAEGAEPRLAWKRAASFVDRGGDAEIAIVFADANTGALLAQHSQIWTAKNRSVHDGTGICLGGGASLPGPLLISEGQMFLPSDTPAKEAYSGTGKTWDFYKYVMSRDSYDGAGAPLVSSVHVKFQTASGCSGNNAAWIPSLQQMVYGDGDGTNFSPLTGDLDVTAHELTHAVTEDIAGLVYQKESGGMNEAMSDILGESVDAFQGCVNWQIGENVYTPNTSGDALRYMYNPTLDNYSLDYYPDYLSHPVWAPPGCVPSNGNDKCGVHGTSGIANLAFYLLSVGGTHPQGKTAVVVPEVGIDIARKVFYKSLFYMTANDGFSAARTATVQAANSLYQCADLKNGIVNAIGAAWEAVGVPEESNPLWPLNAPPGPGDSPTGPFPPPCNILPDTIQLFNNTGFESGAVVWGGTSGVVTNAVAQPAYSGSWKAWLGGDGVSKTETVRQRVHIPAIATSATLTFRLHVDSAESSGVKDTLSLVKSNPCGIFQQLPVTITSWSNLNEGAGYTLKTVDLSAYIGQSILLSFTSVENASLQTSFVLDSMSLAVK